MLYELGRNTDFRFLRWRLCRTIFIYFWTVSHSFYIRHDQNYEKKSGASVVSFASRIKTGTVGRTLWNPSYCAVTVSDRSREIKLIAYIEGAKEREKESKGCFMQIVSSYGVEVKQNIPIRHTLDIFRRAVSYLIRVYAESWEELSGNRKCTEAL